MFRWYLSMITKTKKMEENSTIEKSQLWPQIITVLTCLVLATSTGLHAGWSSPAVAKLQASDLGFKVSDAEVSYIVMLYPLGYIVSSPICAFLIDSIGRKHSLLVFAAPQILAWILIATSSNVPIIFVARLIAGFSEGSIFSVMPAYICEIAEPKVRGRLGMGYTTAFVFGFFLINCYGSYMPLRTSAYLSLGLPLLFLFTFIWMPESPYFFLMKGYPEYACSSLKWLRRMQNVDGELAKLTSDVQRQLSEPSRIKDVFTIKSNLKALLIILGLRALQQFSGGASIIFYSQLIFKQAGGSISYSESAIIFNATLFIVSLSGLLLVDRHGRRPLLMWSIGGTVFCLLTEAVYFSLQYHSYDISDIGWLPVTGMVCYTMVRGVGLLAIPTLMSGELFSASIKAKAMGIVTVFMALCMSFTSKLFQFLDKSFGMHVPFFLFVVGSIVGLVFVYFCVPETKGKTLEEIQQKLKGHFRHQLEAA